MPEKLQYNPKNKGIWKEKQKDISSLLSDAEKIYKSWKEADKTDNKNWITNIETRKKYIYFKEKWENIKKQHDNMVTLTNSQKNKLIEEIENMKIENKKYESISTIASIFYYLKKENKNWKLDKSLQKLNIAQNIEEIVKNPKKIDSLLKKLEEKTWEIPKWEVAYNYIVSDKNKKLSKEEKTLYSLFYTIKNFYNYAENWWVKIDLNKDDKIFKKELNNFEQLEEKYNSKNKNNNENIKNKKINKNNEKISNNSDNYIKLDNLIYNYNSSIITVNKNNWVKTIKVSEYDKKILKKDNIENYLKIHETFEKAWIIKLTQFLPQISSAIWWNINYNDDFLKENELKQVLNTILTSTWYKTIDINKNLNEFINIFSNYKNKKQYWWYKDNFYKIWKSEIEEKFLEKFVINKIKFDFTKFQKEAKIKKNPT